jgi:hypothetical protein
MGTRTVRLDQETERVLAELQRASGESVSTLLKRALVTLRSSLDETARPHPYQVYERLDLGEGGHALAPARRAKQSIRAILERKRRK